MFPMRIVPRQESPWWDSCLVVCASLGLSLAVCAGLLALQGRPAGQGLWILASSAAGSAHALEDAALRAMPLYLCALGVAVAFRMQVWNIGAEGQYALGAVGATAAVLLAPGLPAALLLPCMFLCAAAAGAAWGFAPALLKNRLGVSEVIASLMLNYVAIQVVDFLVFGPWKDPTSFGFPMTREFPEAALIPRLPGLRLHWGLAPCVLAGAGLWFFLARTRLGYELRAAGANPKAAGVAGIDAAFLTTLAMGLGGALAGVAGGMVASTVGRLQPGVMAGYGYTAIVVAWLAGLSPVAIALASLFLAALRVGMEGLELELMVPQAFGQVLEGVFLLTILAGGFFRKFTLRRG